MLFPGVVQVSTGPRRRRVLVLVWGEILRSVTALGGVGATAEVTFYGVGVRPLVGPSVVDSVVVRAMLPAV